MDIEFVELEYLGAGVSRLTLSQPSSYNALSLEMIRKLKERFIELGESDDTRAIILRGEGRGFCAGHDLKEIRTRSDRDFYRDLVVSCSELMQTIQDLSQPVIAQVHGVATAAGCQLVASCDLAVASEQARFATPGVLIGLFCSTPMVALSRTVSQKRAMEMLLLGDMISAAKAEEWGLINRTVNESDLENTVMEIAEKIASKSAYAVKAGKAAFYRQMDMNIGEAYEYCTQVMVDNLLASDAAEGVSAFLEKRTPSWKHC